MGNMARSNPGSGEGCICRSCIFCLIASGQDKEAEVMEKDKELECFRDIDPAAPHHYLVVPRQHIHSCFLLSRRHVGLVERMVEMGKAVLRNQGITDMRDIRLGFHKPPHISVDHLHLHVLAPTTQNLGYMLYKFTPETESFISEEHLRTCLRENAPLVKCCRPRCVSAGSSLNRCRTIKKEKQHPRVVSEPEPATRKDEESVNEILKRTRSLVLK